MFKTFKKFTKRIYPLRTSESIDVCDAIKHVEIMQVEGFGIDGFGFFLFQETKGNTKVQSMSKDT